MTLVPILMYHEIANKDNLWCVKPEEFKKQMAFLKENCFIAITPDDLYEHIKNNKEIPPKSVILTFDDGRRGVYDCAFPLLEELGFKAVLYIVADWADGGKVHDEERYSEFLSWDQIKELANYFEIGCHGKSHRNLARLEEDELKKEIFDSKKEIEDRLVKKVCHFSYPYGFFNEKIKKIVLEAGYKTAVTANKGMNTELLELSRQWVLNNTSIEDFKKLVSIPTLSICMITKDEEEHLADCLNSVKSIADEIIITDTGSKDKTKEIAKGFTGKVYDFQWQNDFSKARNFSLSKATKDWILVLDADEAIAEKDLTRIKELITNKDIMGYRFVTRNYTNDSSITGWLPAVGYKESRDFSGFFPSIKVRLFQNTKKSAKQISGVPEIQRISKHNKGIKFDGVVHEMVDGYIEKIKGKIVLADIPIHHYGAARDKEFSRKKEEYLELAKTKLADAKSLYELGILSKEIGRLDEAEKAFMEAVRIDDKFGDAYYNLGVVYEMQKRYDEAIAQYKKALSFGKHSDALFGIGVCLLKKSQLDEAAEYFEEAIKINPFNVKAFINLGVIYEKKCDYKKAISALKNAVELNPKNAKAYFNLAIVYEKEKDFKNAVIAYSGAAELNHEKKEEIAKKINELKNLITDIGYSYSVGMQ